MATDQQYIVVKFVNATSVDNAIKKSKRVPVSEVYIHNGWFEKNNFEFHRSTEKPITGFVAKE